MACFVWLRVGSAKFQNFSKFFNFPSGSIFFAPSALDEWNIHEKLCLASAVASSGDQNWMSVSRSLKSIVNSSQSRPEDWFVNRNCAIQYGKLLDAVDTPKRKKVSIC